jgi:hypothetical protein
MKRKYYLFKSIILWLAFFHSKVWIKILHFFSVPHFLKYLFGVTDEFKILCCCFYIKVVFFFLKINKSNGFKLIKTVTFSMNLTSILYKYLFMTWKIKIKTNLKGCLNSLEKQIIIKYYRNPVLIGQNDPTINYNYLKHEISVTRLILLSCRICEFRCSQCFYICSYCRMPNKVMIAFGATFATTTNVWINVLWW